MLSRSLQRDHRKAVGIDHLLPAFLRNLRTISICAVGDDLAVIRKLLKKFHERVMVIIQVFVVIKVVTVTGREENDFRMIVQKGPAVFTRFEEKDIAFSFSPVSLPKFMH